MTVPFPAEAGDSSLFHSVQTDSGILAASYPMDNGALSQREKFLGREANYSLPSSVENNNG
jgi:hypothetical protein